MFSLELPPALQSANVMPQKTFSCTLLGSSRMCTRLCHQMHQILLMLHQLSGFRMNLHKSLTTFSLPPARSHRSIFEPPLHQTQTEKFMARRRKWIYKNGSIKIARIGAWSDHPSALGNVFSVHNAEQFLKAVMANLLGGSL